MFYLFLFERRSVFLKLSLKFKPELSAQQISIIEDLSFHTTKLYNIANHDCHENGFKVYEDMEPLHKGNWHNEYLHSHTYQQCLKMVDQNWKSYFSAIKGYKKNPSKYLGMPKPPKYKNTKDRKNEVIFTNLAIRFEKDVMMLSLAKPMQEKYGVKSLNFEVSKKLQSRIDFCNLQQVRIKWDQSLKQWYLVIIYKQEEAELPAHYNNVMAIDLGLSNLGAITFLYGNDSYIVNGKPLKSMNSYINKRIAHLQSISMSMKKGSEHHKDTKQITALRRKRENYIHNYMHQASSLVIKLAHHYEVWQIVIGDMKNIKQNMSYNKSFVQIPQKKFAELIKYKAKLCGIKVVFINEAYTSGCSSFDLEKISKKSYDKKRRIHRGLFKTNDGILLNADVNGSLNILRKHVKDACIPELITSARDKGRVNAPLKLQAA